MQNHFVRRLAALCWALALGIHSVVAADFIEPRGDLTLSGAVNAALLRNPQLQSADFSVRIAEAEQLQAGLRPNPELGLSAENFGGNGALRGSDTLETTLTLSQLIELGGKRDRRVNVAGLQRDAAAIERESRQLDILADIARRFISVAEQQEQLLLLRREREIAAKTLDAIAVRVRAARTPEAERSRAAIALSRAQIEEQRALQQLLGLRRRLAVLWGSTEPRFGDVRANLFALPAVDDFAQLAARLNGSPDFLRFANETRLRDAQWQLALAEARSDVTVGAGVRRFEAGGDTGFVVNVSMPLALGNRNQGAIRAAALRRDQVEVEQQAARLEAEAALFEFYQQLLIARDETTRLREQLIPQAETALVQVRYGYERGRFSYLELAAAQRELLDLQRSAISAAATYHRVLAEIERLTATPLARVQD